MIAKRVQVEEIFQSYIQDNSVFLKCGNIQKLIHSIDFENGCIRSLNKQINKI